MQVQRPIKGFVFSVQRQANRRQERQDFSETTVLAGDTDDGSVLSLSPEQAYVSSLGDDV